ncbi:MAG: hypothetical protein ACLVKO_12015 [Dysgonomonas sp.]
MKKKTWFLLLFFVYTSSLLAQEKDISIPKRSVRNNVNVKKNTKENGLEDNVKKHKDDRFTIGIGYARRLGKTMKTGNDDIDKATNDLKNGFNIDFEWQRYYKENWGFGMNVYYNMQHASLDDYYETIDEYTHFIYFGPTFNFRHSLNSEFTLYGNIGVGPIIFIDNVTSSKSVDIVEPAFGIYTSLAIDYNINRTMGMGLKLSVGAGSVSGSKYYLGDRVSASNLMITTYLRFKSSK